MAIQVIHVSDIHFGQGESHGRINPDTGLNTRSEDFASALSRTVDYTLDHGCDVFLFSGDAYRNASPEPTYQKVFATQLKRLSSAGVKSILLVGNHDQLLRASSSHAMSVFQSLEVPGVLIIDRPVCTKIDTTHGAFQLIGLPHITRHHLLAAVDKYLTMPAASIDKILIDHVSTILRAYYESLDPCLPSLVTAHMTVDRAVAGIEQELLLGYALTFPTDIFIDDRIDYVGLGHVHKHQVIRQDAPAIVYAGSLERIDSGESEEDKGFIHLLLSRHKSSWEFHSINPRPFATVNADLCQCTQITEQLCKQIAAKVSPGCILRVHYKMRQDQIPELDEQRVRASASAAMSVRLQPEVVAPDRPRRLPQINESAGTAPLAALEAYFTEIAPDRKERLLRHVSDLMSQLRSPADE